MHNSPLYRTWKHCWNLFSESTFIIVILLRKPSGDSQLYPFSDVFSFGTNLARAVDVAVLFLFLRTVVQENATKPLNFGPPRRMCWQKMKVDGLVPCWDRKIRIG